MWSVITMIVIMVDDNDDVDDDNTGWDGSNIDIGRR